MSVDTPPNTDAELVARAFITAVDELYANSRETSAADFERSLKAIIVEFLPTVFEHRHEIFENVALNNKLLAPKLLFVAHHVRLDLGVEPEPGDDRDEAAETLAPLTASLLFHIPWKVLDTDSIVTILRNGLLSDRILRQLPHTMLITVVACEEIWAESIVVDMDRIKPALRAISLRNPPECHLQAVFRWIDEYTRRLHEERDLPEGVLTAEMVVVILETLRALTDPRGAGGESCKIKYPLLFINSTCRVATSIIRTLAAPAGMPHAEDPEHLTQILHGLISNPSPYSIASSLRKLVSIATELARMILPRDSDPTALAGNLVAMIDAACSDEPPMVPAYLRPSIVRVVLIAADLAVTINGGAAALSKAGFHYRLSQQVIWANEYESKRRASKATEPPDQRSILLTKATVALSRETVVHLTAVASKLGSDTAQLMPYLLDMIHSAIPISDSTGVTPVWGLIDALIDIGLTPLLLDHKTMHRLLRHCIDTEGITVTLPTAEIVSSIVTRIATMKSNDDLKLLYARSGLHELIAQAGITLPLDIVALLTPRAHPTRSSVGLLRSPQVVSNSPYSTILTVKSDSRVVVRLQDVLGRPVDPPHGPSAIMAVTLDPSAITNHDPSFSGDTCTGFLIPVRMSQGRYLLCPKTVASMKFAPPHRIPAWTEPYAFLDDPRYKLAPVDIVAQVGPYMQPDQEAHLAVFVEGVPLSGTITVIKPAKKRRTSKSRRRTTESHLETLWLDDRTPRHFIAPDGNLSLKETLQGMDRSMQNLRWALKTSIAVLERWTDLRQGRVETMWYTSDDFTVVDGVVLLTSRTDRYCTPRMTPLLTDDALDRMWSTTPTAHTSPHRPEFFDSFVPETEVESDSDVDLFLGDGDTVTIPHPDTLGRSRWLPVETVRHGIVCDASRTYVAGVIVWELLTQRTPLDWAATLDEAKAELLSGAMFPLNSLPTTHLRDVMAGCVGHSMAHRPRISLLLDALKDVLAKFEAGTLFRMPSPPQPPPPDPADSGDSSDGGLDDETLEAMVTGTVGSTGASERSAPIPVGH
ncbi:Protein tyrosine kinase [Carpediemonas membranifera]|uniref:Protein tyrosine kinase n=1 Tax=Carpediemonas membranifera TaxID=201153 RepID=A0A8J6E269_9EUKA|nr:Protein tyrosine kinase [Carpediemonas membranifera]|eukprot:KAG9397254.1 Protein tyrosine kinase [Carpediemonas membranifera]